MSGRIVIELLDEAGELDVSVSVTGELHTLQVIGLMEIAKEQHLRSKRMPGPVVFGFDGASDGALAVARRLPDGRVEMLHQ